MAILIYIGAPLVVYLIAKFLFDPVLKFSGIKSEITKSLIYYANVYMNPGWGKNDHLNEAMKALRDRACELTSKTNAIRCYKLLQFLKMLPRKSDIKKAENRLIGLSNSVYDTRQAENNTRRLKEIEELLHIKTGIS